MKSRIGLLGLSAVLMMGAVTPARAQTTATFPTYEVTGGYQVLHVPDNWFPFGLNLDGAFNVNESVGLVGEIGWVMDSDDEDGVDVNVHGFNFGVGPRFNVRTTGQVWPFAQVLVGALHARSSVEFDDVDISVNDTRFMVQPGGGVNINAGDGWGIVLAADYRRVFLDDDDEDFDDDDDFDDDGVSGENEFRVFAGIRLLLD